ncbi:MAG: hypothetical protein ACRDKE_09425 [Solirubrobacterales bacterium]
MPNEAALDATISSYIVQGYVVQNRGADFVVMFKKKEFSVLWAVVGLILCLIPLIIYLIVYAAESDKMVEIRVEAMAPSAGGIQYSEDGNYYWDAASSSWQLVAKPASASPIAPPEPDVDASAANAPDPNEGPIAPEQDADS